MTAPGPLASAATRPWVSGTPRALITRRGRGSPAGATASTARASTSGRITMPGPPPAGVSSTERCLSVACVRMSTASSVHRPAASALPARLTPSGPGNISGKMVRMVARHMMLDVTDWLKHLRLCLKHVIAAYSVRSPPPCGEGLGWGSRDSFAGGAIIISPHHPLPTLPQPAAGLPASGKFFRDQTPAGRGLVGGGSRPSSPLALIPLHTNML